MHRPRWPCRCLAPLAGKSRGSSRGGLAALDSDMWMHRPRGGRADASPRLLMAVRTPLSACWYEKGSSRAGLAALDFGYECLYQ